MCVRCVHTRVCVFGEWNENGPALSRASSSGMIAIYRELALTAITVDTFSQYFCASWR